MALIASSLAQHAMYCLAIASPLMIHRSVRGTKVIFMYKLYLEL